MQPSDAETDRLLPHPTRRVVSLRATLTGLVLAVLLPGMIASAIVLYVSYRNERAQLERGAVQTARALAFAVDSELMKAETAAQALATSANLTAGNFAAFHAQAAELLRRTGAGTNFVLTDSAGQQIVNTLRPFPGPLPRHGNPEQVRRVFETGQPAVSDIFIGGLARAPRISIDVPVLIGGRVAYVLGVGLTPERMGSVLGGAALPPGWIATIYDTRGVIAARTEKAEQFVGREGPAALLERMAKAREGMMETVTVEGIPVSAVFSRSTVSNWRVAIAIPSESFAAELRNRVALLGLGVLTLLGIGLGLAWLLAARIANSIHSLAGPALALGSGEPVAMPRARLREVDEVAAALGTASELLARRTAELEAANTEMQEFSYSISHDLSTPLRAITGFAQIVADEYGAKLDADARRMLAQIRENTVRMSLLIESLIDFMQMSRRKLVHDTVDMAVLAREVFDAQRAARLLRRVELRLGDLPPAWGDRTLLRRVLWNLMENAMKFIPVDTDGRIEISGREAGGETIYRVADNGIGFDMQYVGKLFKVFEHVHAPGEFEGVGIGLAVVKRIVGRHGGRVWAEGETGRGAAFYFALPTRTATNRP